MNALEIKQKLNKFPRFKGVYSRDNLPKKLIHPFGVIVNWDRKSEPGSHWCAIFVDANRNGHYFDPLGITPIFPELTTFILNNSNQSWSNEGIQIQDKRSTSCGKFCVSFLKSLFRGNTYCEFLSSFHPFPLINEIIVSAKKER